MTNYPAPSRVAAATPAPSDPDPLPSDVLVVDDEAVVREFLTACLERAGHTVRAAGTAPEALQLMMNKPASLVLADIRMPDHDGVWLLERLQTRWPQTPVVMVTAIDDMETIRMTRRAGAVDFVTKPVNPGQLLELVTRLTGSGSTAPPVAEVPEAAHAPERLAAPEETQIEAEYTLETPLRCPGCGERIGQLKAVRLIRAQVNFTSTLPRRGRVLACPHCLSVLTAELTNF